MLKNTLLGIIGIFLLTSLIHNVTEFQKNKQFYATVKNDFETQRKKNDELKMNAIKSKNEMELEKTIRNKLNYVKPNEIAIIVPTPTDVPIIVTPTPRPVYQQWVFTFFK